MARPGWPRPTITARSSRQSRRFPHLINADMVFGTHSLCADSEEKREPASDIDSAVVDSLKVLDPKRPIREADIDSRAGLMGSDADDPGADVKQRRATIWLAARARRRRAMRLRQTKMALRLGGATRQQSD